MSSKLTTTDLARELLPAQNEWQYIGLALGLKDYDIEGIDGKNQQERLTMMLSTVLKKRFDLTWEKIIAVLRDPLVSHHALAEKLELNPEIGKPKGQGASKIPGLIPKDSSSKAKYDSIDGVPNKDPDIGSSQPYAMKNRRALIINIMHYKDPKMETRFGSDKDEDALFKTLEMLDYTVQVEPDLNGDKIKSIVLEYAEKDKNCDSFICCILAHGNQGVVCGSDGKRVDIKDISEALNKVTHLRGNPKIFFFQACQGTKNPAALKTKVAERDCESSASSAKESNAKYAERDVAIPKLPRDSDFFYGFPSSYETVCMRDSEGSLYIQALCRVLKSKYKEEDLLTMVTRVHYLVAKEERSLDEGEKEDVLYQQQPQLMSTLRQLVRF